MSKPAASQHQACQGCASFSDNSTARPLTARDVQMAAATLARDPGLVQFGRRFAISMGSHLSSRLTAEATTNYPSICQKSSPSDACVSCPSDVRAKVARSAFLCSPTRRCCLPSLARLAAPSYDFTCKAFIDRCSHSPSRLAASRVADSAPKSVQARLLCYFGS